MPELRVDHHHSPARRSFEALAGHIGAVVVEFLVPTALACWVRAAVALALLCVRGLHLPSAQTSRAFSFVHDRQYAQSGFFGLPFALANYEQINDVRRDQRQTQKALDAMEEVSKRFPDSPYAKDAEKKALLAKDHLAAKEMEIGRYYLGKGSHLAGINRFKRVVTDYQTTSHTPEALYRIAEGYMALGVTSEAQTAAAVLGHNFPTSRWYKDAYTLVSSDGRAPVENESSWISRAFDAVTPG